MHALRLAREYTGREKFIKFDGHFHGYHDYVMWNYGGYSPRRRPGGRARRHAVKSGGIPAGIAEYVILLPFNDLEAVRRTLWLHGHEIAASSWSRSTTTRGASCRPRNTCGACSLSPRSTGSS